MDLERNNETTYINRLPIDKFSRMLDDPTQCYKFYWFEAIMILFQSSKDDLLFDDIFNEMIYVAWNSVTKFHLSLGPKVNGAPVNLLERAIHIIENNSKTSLLTDKHSIIEAIKRNETKLIDCKKSLAKNVPYRLLSSFMDEIGGNDEIWDHKEALIQYIGELNNSISLPYIIVDGKGYKKKVRINPQWRQYLIDNYPIITSWIRLKKIQFLQDRNPDVHGIVYKL